MKNSRRPARIRVPYTLSAALALVLGLRTAGAEPPELTPLDFLPGDTAIAPAAAEQQSPEIVRGGDGFLAVWVDQRSSLVNIPLIWGGISSLYFGTQWDVYAARLDADGALLDTSPIVVTNQTFNQGMPDVAWNGENWLVVWSGQEIDGWILRMNIYAARVSPAGEVLDDPPIVIDTDPTQSGLLYPCVASDGANWLVAWRDLDETAGVGTLDGARVAPDGTVLDPGGVRLRQDVQNSYPVNPDVTFAGDEYLLVWRENPGEIAGQLLTPALDTIGGVFPVNVYSPTKGENPRVATDGVDFLVTWWEDFWDYSARLYAARVSHTGTVMDSAGIVLPTPTTTGIFEPSVDWNGVDYQVAYAFYEGLYDYNVYVTRVSASGEPLDTGGILVSNAPEYQLEAAVAGIPGGGAVVLWTDYRDQSTDPGDIYACTVDAQGVPGPEAVLSLGLPRQSQLRLAPDGGGAIAVFRSETSQSVRIMAQRFDASGEVVDAEPIEVVTGMRVQRPSAAWNGQVYFVVWEEGSEIYGRRLAADGTFVDPEPVSCLPGNGPDVAAVGDLFLVVSSHEDPHEIRRPKAVRVRGSDGAVLGPPVTIGSNHSLFPRVTAFGGRWFAVWEQRPTHDDPLTSVYGAFVGLDGVGEGPVYVAADVEDAEELPAVAASGDTALVVFQDDRAYPRDLYARRLLTDGTVLDYPGIRLTSAANSQYDPSLVWDGSQYVLAFSDHRNDGAYDQHRGDVYGTRISGTGEVLDPDGFAVLNDPRPEIMPAAAALDGPVLLAASVFREAPFRNYRIGFRLLSPTVTASPEPVTGVTGLALAASPNPFGPRVTLRFTVESAGLATLRIYDARGAKVRELLSGPVARGAGETAWNGRDDAGDLVASGVYLAVLETGGRRSNVKIVLAR